MFALSAEHIAAVRAVTRLELLRTVLLSQASESLDGQTVCLIAKIELDHDCFVASYEYLDSRGVSIGGGTL